MPDTTVLFLHGFGGSQRHWQPVLSRLPAFIRPIVMDLPGHGLSDKRLSENFSAMVQDVLRHIQSETHEPITVIGHSFGGLISQALAIQYPEKVSRLILVSTASNLTLHPELITQLQNGMVDPHFIAAGFADSVSTSIKSLVAEDFQQLKMGETQLFHELNSIDFARNLSLLTMPVMVLTGLDDAIVSPRRQRRLSQGITGAQSVEVAECGHYPHLEQASETAKRIAHFLEQKI